MLWSLLFDYLYDHRFPTGSSRTIHWNEIKSIAVERNRNRLQLHSWGMGLDFQVWYVFSICFNKASFMRFH